MSSTKKEKILIPSKNLECIIERAEDSYQRRFVLTTPDPLVRLDEEKKEHNYISNITALKDIDQVLFKVGKPFLFNGEPFYPKFIQQGKTPNSYHILIDILNHTSLFMLPFLGGSSYNYKLKSLLINSHIEYLEDEEDSPHIYLLYRFEESKDYEELEKYLKGHVNYKKEFHPDKYHILYKFSIPEQFIEDYYKIINSKYSQISNGAKVRILQFHGNNPKDHKTALYGILYKTEARRKGMEEGLNTYIPTTAELFQAFEIEKNIYTPYAIY